MAYLLPAVLLLHSRLAFSQPAIILTCVFDFCVHEDGLLEIAGAGPWKSLRDCPQGQAAPNLLSFGSSLKTPKASYCFPAGVHLLILSRNDDKTESVLPM